MWVFPQDQHETSHRMSLPPTRDGDTTLIQDRSVSEAQELGKRDHSVAPIRRSILNWERERDVATFVRQEIRQGQQEFDENVGCKYVMFEISTYKRYLACERQEYILLPRYIMGCQMRTPYYTRRWKLFARAHKCEKIPFVSSVHFKLIWSIV